LARTTQRTPQRVATPADARSEGRPRAGELLAGNLSIGKRL